MMESFEEQIIRKTTDNEISAAISGSKSHNPGLKALLSIKKNTATLEKEYSELLQVETELEELNQEALLIIEANTSPEAISQWMAVVHETDNAVKGMNDTLTGARKKLALNEKDGYPELWKQLALHLTALKNNSKNAADSGLKLLPGAIHPQWETEFVRAQTPLVELIVKYGESCRVLLQMIERYSPDELNSLNHIIIDHVPVDFTYEEAKEYQQDYFKALANFKNEFKKDKNLWDKFLDILAGGTHQLPSEGAMMERWLNGEEAEL